jgi:hypothetical protein
VALVRATAPEAAGATLVVAGLGVAERSVKQLRRLGYRVVVAVAPELVLSLPDVERLAVHDEAELQALRSRLQPELEVGADVVRASGRLDAEPHRVHDEASRRHAEDAVFAELMRGDLGVVARTLNNPSPFASPATCSAACPSRRTS